MSSFPTFAPIIPPDESARRRAEELRSTRATHTALPEGSMGRLEDVGSWIAACQGTVPPAALTSVRLIVVAGEHGVAAHNPSISALNSTFSADAAQAVRSGEALVVSAARRADVSISLLDANLSHPSGQIDREDAMSTEEMIRHVRRGMDIADEEADRAIQVLVVGDVGRGLTTVAPSVIASLCGIEPVRIIGRGSGIDDQGWKVKLALIRDAMYRVRDDRTDVLHVLRRIAGPDIAVLMGLLAQAAVRRTPVILDGVGVAAAAMCAQMLAPGASAWWMAASSGNEPATTAAFNALHLEPLLDMPLGTGMGIGGVMAVAFLRLAVEILAEES